MEKVGNWWKVSKISTFENISVSKPVNFGSFTKNRNLIQLLLNPANMKLNVELDNESESIPNENERLPFDIRYLLCAGPPLDLSALMAAMSGKQMNTSNNNDSNENESKSEPQDMKLAKKAHRCEKCIIGIAVFDGQDMIVGYLVNDRLIKKSIDSNQTQQTETSESNNNAMSNETVKNVEKENVSETKSESVEEKSQDETGTIEKNNDDATKDTENVETSTSG